MSKNKKDIRENFKKEVFERDNYTCQICGDGPYPEMADDLFDAHHITDRSKMPAGGYVKENGITVCKYPKGLTITENEDFVIENDSCHMKCEKFHLSEGTEWNEGMHPDDLYKKINSNFELAYKKSLELKNK